MIAYQKTQDTRIPFKLFQQNRFDRKMNRALKVFTMSTQLLYRFGFTTHRNSETIHCKNSLCIECVFWITKITANCSTTLEKTPLSRHSLRMLTQPLNSPGWKEIMKLSIVLSIIIVHQHCRFLMLIHSCVFSSGLIAQFCYDDYLILTVASVQLIFSLVFEDHFQKSFDTLSVIAVWTCL